MKSEESNVEFKGVVNALLESMLDKSEAVNLALQKSLCKISNTTDVNIVLLTCCEFLKSKKKLQSDHVGNVLSTMEQICLIKAPILEESTIDSLIEFVIAEMTSSTDYVPAVQISAAGILVALGNVNIEKVITPVMDILKPSIIPHYTIPHSLGALAITNINGVIPFIKIILAKMLPTLGMIKLDPLRQAFAYALGNFSIAFIDYNSNNKDSEVKLDSLSTEFSICYDVLFHYWLHSNEPSVTINVLQALGPMINLITVEKHTELMPKLISTILSLYKRLNLDSFYVTQALSYILTKSIQVPNLLTSAMVETISSNLFMHIQTLPDYDQSPKIKNHFETLRCYDILVSSFSNCTLEFLYYRSKIHNDEDKMKVIVILTHLLVSSEKEVAPNFITFLKEMIKSDTSIKMKRIILKATVALAYKQNLLEADNSVLIDFIMKIICSSGENLTQTSDNKEMNDLYNDYESSLYLLSSTVTNIKPILWPLLLKYLMSSKDNHSTAIIIKCLIQLLQPDETEDGKILDIKVEKPTNESIFVRCLSLLNRSYDNKMFNGLLAFLSKYCGNIHKDLAISWELDLRHLFTYLGTNGFKNTVWESMVLDLFRSALFLVNDNYWIQKVSHEILEQIHQNEHNIAQKGILYKFLAILLCNMIDVENVDQRLDVFFNALPNSVEGEKSYLAQALGIASIKHGFKIIEKLDELCKAIDLKQSSRFLKFSFIKSHKHEMTMNNTKHILTLCYGEVAKELLDVNVLEKLVRTYMEGCGTSIHWIINILQNKSSTVQIINSALTSLYFIAKAINSISHNNLILQERWQLLNLVLDQISEEEFDPNNFEAFPAVIKALSSLILLQKYLNPEERNVVLKILCSKVFHSILVLSTKIATDKELEYCKSYNLIENIKISFNSLLNDFMVQSTCPSTLDDILSILDQWLIDENVYIRYAAIIATQSTLDSFIKNIKLTYENPSRFSQSGQLIGRLVPRCTDESTAVRKIAVDSIKIVIQIIDLYEGHIIEPEYEKLMSDLKDQMDTSDDKILTKVLDNVANIIGDKVQHHQIIILTENLLDGMQMQDSSDLACNVVLNNIFKNKGNDLYQNVEDVMKSILTTLPRLKMKGKVALLNTMLTFTQHHPKSVVAFLLMQPLPYDNCVNECWSTLAQDSSLSLLIFDTFLNILSEEEVFEESLKYESAKIVSVKYLAVISAMSEMLSHPDMKSICEDKFAELFSMLYTTLACFVGASSPAHSLSSDKRTEKFGFIPNSQSVKMSPAKIAVDALKALLVNVNCPKLIDVVLTCNELESASFLSNFFEIVGIMVKLFCEEYPYLLLKLIASLNIFSRAALISQRIAVITFFNHLVSFRCIDNLVMLDTVVATLNAGWRDTALEIRAISLSGLSNVKCLKREQQEQLMQSVISSMYHGLDDYQGSVPRTNVPLVAIISLTEFLVLDLIDDKLIDSFTPIALRIKAFMNTENPVLREASIRLFGEIILKQKSDSLSEQAFVLLPCFLLHLADDDENVIKACKQTLKKISPTFNAVNSNAMIQNHLIDTAKLHISDFLTDLIKCISTELPQNVPQLIESTSNYLNSPWDTIRAKAALMIGLFFTNYDLESTAEGEYDKSKKLMTSRMLQLLKDKNSAVRISAASAISGLYQTV